MIVVKPKPKPKTTATRKKIRYRDEPMEIHTKITQTAYGARENAGDQVIIGVSFEFNWLMEWRDFSGPITEQSRAKLKTNANRLFSTLNWKFL